jgi:hypothetical protein
MAFHINLHAYHDSTNPRAKLRCGINQCKRKKVRSSLEIDTMLMLIHDEDLKEDVDEVQPGAATS